MQLLNQNLFLLLVKKTQTYSYMEVKIRTISILIEHKESLLEFNDLLF